MFENLLKSVSHILFSEISISCCKVSKVVLKKTRPDICKIYACLYVFVGRPFKPLMHMQRFPRLHSD